jgi:hypothetical protein
MVKSNPKKYRFFNHGTGVRAVLVHPRHLFGTCQIVWFSLNVKLDIHGWQIERQNECKIAKYKIFIHSK